MMTLTESWNCSSFDQMTLRKILVFIGLILSSLVYGQTDSLIIKSRIDSLASAKALKKKRDPRRATMLSAVLPGAGQIYNRKYWKLPILYGGAFTLGYFIKFNHDQYVLSRDSYINVKAGLPDYYKGSYSKEQLVQLREYWRRNRDLLIIISGFTYLLNIADAAVDAHLSSFDVSDDLSMKYQPVLYMAGNQPVIGLGLAFQFH
ncbi:MAG TPA: DUF5683 domain-containing protein [Catalimonadaceae bacterium]|nr:DUF5683 domain-containing protein [Catalimonadaceae bacterium]